MAASSVPVDVMEYNTTASPHKHLTVTFRDVSVEVNGLAEDFGSTFTSVVTDLIPRKASTKPRRVGRASFPPPLINVDKDIQSDLLYSDNSGRHLWTGSSR
jgi:hypothetical protein